MRAWGIKPVCAVGLIAVLTGCEEKDPTSVLIDDTPGTLQRQPGRADCAPDNGGITLPAGFCAVVVADLVMDGEPAKARHMVVTPSGDLFVALNSARNENPTFGIIGLRDRNGDGR